MKYVERECADARPTDKWQATQYCGFPSAGAQFLHCLLCTLGRNPASPTDTACPKWPFRERRRRGELPACVGPTRRLSFAATHRSMWPT